MLVLHTSPRVDADFGKSALMRIAKLKNSLARGPEKNGDKSAVVMLKQCEHYHGTGRPVVNENHQIYDNWVAFSDIWSRRCLHRFCGRAQTYGTHSDV